MSNADAFHLDEAEGLPVSRKQQAEKRKRALIIKNLPFVDEPTKRKYLYRAVREGDLEIVHLLLDKPSNHHNIATKKTSPHHLAPLALPALKSHQTHDYERDFESAPPHFDKPHNSVNTARSFASAGGGEWHEEIATVAETPPTEEDSSSPIQLPVRTTPAPDNSNLIEMTCYGDNLLLTAIKSGQEQVAMYLVNKGFDTDFYFLTTDLDQEAANFFATSCRQSAYAHGMYDLVQLMDDLERQAEKRRELARLRSYWQMAAPVLSLDSQSRSKSRAKKTHNHTEKSLVRNTVLLPPIATGLREQDKRVEMSFPARTSSFRSDEQQSQSSRAPSRLSSAFGSRPQSRTNKTATIRRARALKPAKS